MRSALKGNRFETVEAVKRKATDVMNMVSENDWQQCFQQRKIRMQRYKDRAGEYFKGDHVSIVPNVQ